nr:TlpA disulfide reductase family protein [Prevotella sp.]
MEIPFLAVPNDTTTVTIDLTTLTLAATHLFANDSDVKKYVWFEGKHAAIDTELQSVKTKISVFGVTFFDDICGMTPLQYRDYVQQSYGRLLAAINSNVAIGSATRTLAQSILSMNYASALFGFKNNISMAPMIAGKRGVPRANMRIDTLSYFKPLEQLSVLRSENQRYYHYLSDFTSALRRQYMSADPLLDDIAIGKRLSRSFNRKCPLTEQQIAVAHDSIANDMVRELILANNDDLKSQLSAANKKMEEIKKTANTSSLYLSIIDIDPKMSAQQILPTITDKYKGKAVLIDFWNTWCVPCRAAMSAIRPLKEQLHDVVYVYIADASSPVDKWVEMIKTISGVHVRLTKEQAAALAETYKFSGIPTYFVVNKEGKITYQKTSFPGVETLREQLVSVMR